MPLDAHKLGKELSVFREVLQAATELKDLGNQMLKELRGRQAVRWLF